jgi:MFS family permease
MDTVGRKEGEVVKQKNGSIYYGWIIVAASSIITLLTVGLRLGIGPFFKPIMTDLGMTRTELSMIVAISMIVYGLGMPLAGSLLKRYSTRFVLITGMILSVGSIVWTINSKEMVSFLLSFGVLLSLGLSFMSPVTLTPIISRWFVRQKGRALFYLSTGSMAGIAVITPLSMILIESIGWQQTLLLFAGIFMCIVIPSALFIMRDQPPDGADGIPIHKAEDNHTRKVDTQPEITWKDAVKTRAYWQIVIGLFVCGFSMNLLGSHAVPMLMDHHFDATIASYGIGTIGIVAIFSTILLGSIADRFPRKNILFWIYFVRGLGFLGLVFVISPWQLYFVATIGGLVWGGSIAMASAILSDLYGVHLLGFLYGWAYFGHQIGAALGSFIGGWGFETFGTHVVSFGLTTVLLIIAGLVSFLLPERINFSTQTLTDHKPLETGM